MATSYSEVLGGAWQELPPAVQRCLTAPLVAHGSLKVYAPSSRTARAVARLIKLPPAGDDVKASVELREVGKDVEWVRTFDGMRAVSVQRLDRGALLETAEPFRLQLVPRVKGRALAISSGKLWIYGMPAPRWLGPAIKAKLSEGPDDVSWQVSVWIGHPWLGGFCEYEGVMRPE